MNNFKNAIAYKTVELENSNISLIMEHFNDSILKTVTNLTNKKSVPLNVKNEFIIKIKKEDGLEVQIKESECSLLDVNKNGNEKVTISYEYGSGFCKINLIYTIEKALYLKKQIIITPLSGRLFIRDIIMEEIGRGDYLATRGGEGQPVFFDNELFMGIEFPISGNMVNNTGIVFSHTPGAYVGKDETFSSYKLVYGLKVDNTIEETFKRYIKNHQIRDNYLNPRIYCDWGLHDELSNNVELDEKMTLDMLEHLKYIKEQYGITFDYYLIDAFWFEENNIYTTFKKKNWPGGFAKVRAKLDEMQMKLGLWFDLTGGFLKMQAMDDVKIESGRNALCLGHESYAQGLKMALLHHIKENKVKMIKFDFAEFECSNPVHNHLTGAESREYLINILLGIIEEVRKAEPEIIILAYNGFTTKMEWLGSVDSTRHGWAISPLWAFHMDYMYCGDPRPSEIPALELRDSINYYTDAMVRQFCESLMNYETIDDHGIMIGNTGTIYYLGKRGWRDNWMLCLSRGNRKIHFYGDIKMFDRGDYDFLSSTWKLFDEFNSNGYKTENVLGNPLFSEIYGYNNGNDVEGYIAIVNPSPAKGNVELQLQSWSNTEDPIVFNKVYENECWYGNDNGTQFYSNKLYVNLLPLSVTMFRWEKMNGENTYRTSNKEFSVNTVLKDKCLISVETLKINVSEHGNFNANNYLILKFKDKNFRPLRTPTGLPEKVDIDIISNKKYTLKHVDPRNIWSGISWAVLKVEPEFDADDELILSVSSRDDDNIYITMEKW